mgnify:CR=1 FL=1
MFDFALENHLALHRVAASRQHGDDQCLVVGGDVEVIVFPHSFSLLLSLLFVFDRKRGFSQTGPQRPIE